jgi:hypothetical protein
MSHEEKIKDVLWDYMRKDELQQCYNDLVKVMVTMFKPEKNFTIDEYNFAVDYLKSVRQYLLDNRIKETPEKI